MFLVLAFLATAFVEDDGVKLLTSHRHENVYVWVKNHSEEKVVTLKAKVTAEGYEKVHAIWTKNDTPVLPGKAKRATFVIPKLSDVKSSDIAAVIVSLNGKVVHPPAEKPVEPEKPKRIAAYVDEVMDGDTVKIHDDTGKRYTFRLNGVDAPENSQPFGLDSRNLLRQYTIGKTLQIEILELDRYQRRLGRIYTNTGEQVNLLMLQKGMAWHYVKYDKSDLYSRAEEVARKARVGIWSQPKQIAPWDYRNGVKVETESPVNAASIRTTDQTVYITEHGSKYHRSGCRHLAKSKQPIPLSRAKSAYEPCKNCRPPSK